MYSFYYSYKLRVEALLIKEEFSQTLEYVKPAIDAIVLAARDLKDSKPLHEVLFLVLKLGNFLNAVSDTLWV